MQNMYLLPNQYFVEPPFIAITAASLLRTENHLPLLCPLWLDCTAMAGAKEVGPH